jgi:CRISPR-associated protein Cas5d
MQGKSPTLSLRCHGPLAVFTRPEFKVERMTYPVMTPSAARGIVEAVLWKPAMRWRIERIKVLRPIEFTSFRRNELISKAVAPPAELIHGGGEIAAYLADEDRAQRNTVALRDVDYVIEGRIELTERAKSDDNVNKFVDMFRRRVIKGQCFQTPYFGCREFPADIRPVGDDVTPIPETCDLGVMLWDIEFGPSNRPVFFRARMTNGVIEVPPDAAAARESCQRAVFAKGNAFDAA